MVPSVRRAALTTTAIALLPSFLDIVSTLLSPFPGLASQRLCLRTYHRVMPSGLLYTPVDDYATLGSARTREARGKDVYRKKQRERERKIESSITVTRPRRSSFSLDEYKSPVMTDRCRSDPSSNHHASYREKMSRGWREALRKNSIQSSRVDRRIESFSSLPTTGFYDNRGV